MCWCLTEQMVCCDGCAHEKDRQVCLFNVQVMWSSKHAQAERSCRATSRGRCLWHRAWIHTHRYFKTLKGVYKITFLWVELRGCIDLWGQWHGPTHKIEKRHKWLLIKKSEWRIYTTADDAHKTSAPPWVVRTMCSLPVKSSMPIKVDLWVIVKTCQCSESLFLLS